MKTAIRNKENINTTPQRRKGCKYCIINTFVVCNINKMGARLRNLLSDQKNNILKLNNEGKTGSVIQVQVMKTAIRNKENIYTTPQRRTQVMVMRASFHESIYTVSVIAYYILDFVKLVKGM
jgi:hypothetical protein